MYLRVEFDMLVNKFVIRKEVKSTNEEETRKKRIMMFNLKNKAGKSDVECVNVPLKIHSIDLIIYFLNILAKHKDTQYIIFVLITI